MASRLQAANAGPNRPLQFRYMESVSEPIACESLRSANLRIEVVNEGSGEQWNSYAELSITVPLLPRPLLNH
jgi:hypothetical protein